MSSFKRYLPPTGSGPSASNSQSSPSVSLRGTKKYVNNQSLLSTGVRELDSVIGGGYLLGSLVLIENDRHSRHGQTLASYYIAEGLSTEQKVAVAELDSRASSSILESLPFNLTWEERSGSFRKNVRTFAGGSSPSLLSMNEIAEGEEEEEEDEEVGRGGKQKRHIDNTTNATGTQSKHTEASPGAKPAAVPSREGSSLKIAWQYEKYISTPQEASKGTGRASQSSAGGVGAPGRSSSVATKYCHSYDLSRCLQEDLVRRDLLNTWSSEECVCSRGSGERLFVFAPLLQKICSFVSTELMAGGGGPEVRDIQGDDSSKLVPQHAGRILLSGLERPLRGVRRQEQMRDLCVLFRALSGLVRKFPLTVVVCLQGECMEPHQLRALEHWSDSVLRLESFAGAFMSKDHEFAEFSGILHLRKVARIRSLTSHTVDAKRYLFSRGRRKFVIEKMHLPPEGSRTPSSAHSSYNEGHRAGADAGAGAGKGSFVKSTSSSPSLASSSFSSSFAGTTKKVPVAAQMCGTVGGAPSGVLDF